MANCWGYLQPEHKGAPHMPKRTHAHARTLHPMWSVNREAGCCARKRTRLLLEREGGRSSSKKHGSLWNKRSSDTVIEDRERERERRGGEKMSPVSQEWDVKRRTQCLDFSTSSFSSCSSPKETRSYIWIAPWTWTFFHLRRLSSNPCLLSNLFFYYLWRRR